MSLESRTGTEVMGHEKLISLRVNQGGRFPFIPNLHIHIYISKGSNPFNFHEIGCLLEGASDPRDTGTRLQVSDSEDFTQISRIINV